MSSLLPFLRLISVHSEERKKEVSGYSRFKSRPASQTDERPVHYQCFQFHRFITEMTNKQIGLWFQIPDNAFYYTLTMNLNPPHGKVSVPLIHRSIRVFGWGFWPVLSCCCKGKLVRKECREFFFSLRLEFMNKLRTSCCWLSTRLKSGEGCAGQTKSPYLFAY